MNKSELRGFKQVFVFELLTGLQKTGFKAFLGIVCAIAFFATPIMVIIGNIKSGNSETPSNIESVYVYNETELSIDYSNFTAMDRYSSLSFITDNSASFDAAVENLESKPSNNDLVVKVSYDEEDGFDVNIVRSSKSGIEDSELDTFESDFFTFFRDETLKSLDISSDDYDYMSKELNVTIMKPNDKGAYTEDTSRFSYDDYILIIGGLMFVFMFINMSVSTVATSIATEKSSRVIEFLLTGTRPIALLSGKIAARLVETLIMTFAGYSCNFLSQLVSVFLIRDTKAVSNTTSSVVTVSTFWETMTPEKLVVAVLYFLAGLALFSIIGALTGASVSKLDELQDAYKLYSFILLICVYADMFYIILMFNSSGHEALQTFFAMFPLTGAFITPALILAGKLSIIAGLIALVIIIITAACTFILASAVYESMLLFQGKRLGVKDIITLMKKQVVV